MRRVPPLVVPALFLSALLVPSAHACSFVAAGDGQVRMPALKVFLDQGDKEGLTLAFQPSFESTTDAVGIILVTPTKPTVGSLPQNFFRELDAFTQLRRRVFPESRFLPQDDAQPDKKSMRRPPRTLDEGFVPAPEFKTVDADGLFQLVEWLKQNRFPFERPKLDFYVDKRWFFTYGKLDLKGLKKDRDGNYCGTVAPFRLSLVGGLPLVPLRLGRPAANETLDTVFYVQGASKMDLPGDLSYQYFWVPLLQHAQGELPRGIPGKGGDWLNALTLEMPELQKKSDKLGYHFVKNQRPQPNAQGQSVASLEWAKRLTAADILALKGEGPLTEALPNLDDGFTEADLKAPPRGDAIRRVILKRLEEDRKKRPNGYLVCDVSPEEFRQLKDLAPYLREGRFLTRFRKTFAAGEVKDDPTLRPAQFGKAQDESEYEERLPGSPG